MKTLIVTAAGVASLLGMGGALAQGPMMEGSTCGGGYGGPWSAILLIAVVAVFVVWIVQRKGK